MRQRFFLFLSAQQLMLLVYFTTTTIIYFLSVSAGGEGVSIQLFGGGNDGDFYLEQSRNVVNNQDAILTSIHALVLGNITKFLGFESVFVFRLFNYCGFFLLLTFSLVLLKQLFRQESNLTLSDRAHLYYSSAIALAIIFMIYPSLLIYVTLSIFRDVWIFAFYILCLLVSIKIIQSKYFLNRFIFTLILLLTLIMLGAYRNYAVLAFIVSLAFCYLIKILKKLKVNLLLFSIIAFLVFTLYYTFFKDWTLPVLGMSLSDALSYRELGLSDYAGGSQMGLSLNQGNVIIFVFNYVYSYIGNLIGPLPWKITGISSLIVFFAESIPFTIILFFLFKNRNLLKKIDHYLLTHAFVWIALIAITNDNIGTATRLRAVGWIIILIVFVKTIVISRANRREIKLGQAQEM